eukprot:193953_1
MKQERISSKQTSASIGGNGQYYGMTIRYHDVQPTYTLQAICLRYNITESALRRAKFCLPGSDIQRGPKKLIIPSTIILANKKEKKKQGRSVRVQVDYPFIDDIFIEKVYLI